ASRLFADLAQARGEGRLLRLMNTLERTNLIIIDLCAACSYVEAMSISPLLTASSTASTQHN
ncbi:MAG: hypothetical protein WAK34_18580, partial [Rhodoplanes sp.]